jgi:hypothetical protein
MTQKDLGLEIIKLWPSVFLESHLPAHEDATRRLIALAESRPGDAVFAIDDPGVAWLKDQLAHAVDAYLHRTGYAQAHRWGARAHFAVQKFGEYRSLGNQPGADLAGMYVLRWPSQQVSAGGRDDGLPGYLSFYDPRVAMNMNAIKRDPYHGYHQSVQPRAGLLLLWPAYVNYFLHPNHSKDAALRVAFDVNFQQPSDRG